MYLVQLTEGFIFFPFPHTAPTSGVCQNVGTNYYYLRTTMKKYYTYDLETFPNCFTFGIAADENKPVVLEASSRKNEFGLLLKVLAELRTQASPMVGFNNIGFDYPILHVLMNLEDGDQLPGEEIAQIAHAKANAIISDGRYSSKKFKHRIGDWNILIPQIDLYLINHFNNKARSTSLKQLEFVMRKNSIRDLPFEPGKILTDDEMQILVEYNVDDVENTRDFFHKCEKEIEFREGLIDQFGWNVMNYNDTKIGKQTFINKLENKLGPDICFTKVNGKRKPRQTPRDQIALADVLADNLYFDLPAFKTVYDWIREQVITETKGVFTGIQMVDVSDHPILDYATDVADIHEMVSDTTGEVLYKYRNKGSAKRISETKALAEGVEDTITTRLASRKMKDLNVVVDGIKYVYGLGGIHASMHNVWVGENQDWAIIDADVTSYYPSNAINLKAYPEHLGYEFVGIYDELKTERISFEKNSVGNKSLKLALNGVYGDSNNKYSPFYDPQFTMTVTLNGQLYVTMLIEKLLLNIGDDVKLIQANTDGITVAIRKTKIPDMAKLCMEWEKYTGLFLEYARYNRMFIRDVNNYIAEYDDGKLKLKGCYEIERLWHKNHSELIVPKVASEHVINGANVEESIINHDDIFDYMGFIKVGSTARLEISRDEDEWNSIQRRSRYIVIENGFNMRKVFPPLKSKPDIERPQAVKSGHKVLITNEYNSKYEKDIRKVIDHDYYIKEVEKITNFKEIEL